MGADNVETGKNATMEFALLKELLTNLLEGSRLTGLYEEKTETWRMMLSRIRPYMINEDGAIKEWSESSDDNHRSLLRERRLFDAMLVLGSML